jgi:hypothetical protein
MTEKRRHARADAAYRSAQPVQWYTLHPRFTPIARNAACNPPISSVEDIFAPIHSQALSSFEGPGYPDSLARSC